MMIGGSLMWQAEAMFLFDVPIINIVCMITSLVFVWLWLVYFWDVKQLGGTCNRRWNGFGCFEIDPISFNLVNIWVLCWMLDMMCPILEDVLLLCWFLARIHGFFSTLPKFGQSFFLPNNLFIWVRSRNVAVLLTWFCYQLIAKPGDKTAAVTWPDPYTYTGISTHSLNT